MREMDDMIQETTPRKGLASLQTKAWWDKGPKAVFNIVEGTLQLKENAVVFSNKNDTTQFTLKLDDIRLVSYPYEGYMNFNMKSGKVYKICFYSEYNLRNRLRRHNRVHSIDEADDMQKQWVAALQPHVPTQPSSEFDKGIDRLTKRMTVIVAILVLLAYLLRQFKG